jgi:ribosome maturation factor RimP
MPVMTRQTLAERITEIAERAARREGIEVWEVEVLGGGRARMVRITIDKPGGVTHGDCELISQQVGTVLDVEDVVPGDRYQLEVSSPGIERKLRKIDDFSRFSGQRARISLREPREGQRRFEALIQGVDGDEILLELKPGAEARVRMTEIEKANLKHEW